MSITEKGYIIEEIPDLTLNKYSSLDGKGVDGVLEKHLAFLRQWNRKGILSGTSIHLYYFYDGLDKNGNYAIGEKGNKLKIYFLIRGETDKMKNVPKLVSASPLSAYFKFTPCPFEDFLKKCNIENVSFSNCCALTKKESFITPSVETAGDQSDYYVVSQWETNEDARLYNMSTLMESLDMQILYRVDLYPVEKSESVHNSLRKTTSILKDRQYSRAGAMGQRDFEAENVLREYNDLQEAIESSPHFIANIFVFANDAENAAVVLDAASAEAIKKGNFEIPSFEGNFNFRSFFDKEKIECHDFRKNIIMQRGSEGLVICKELSKNRKLKYLPVLFTLEDIAPFFRLPALYEGEVVQKRKETAPKSIAAKVYTCKNCGKKIETFENKNVAPKICLSCGKNDFEVEENALYLGTDDNGYDVLFPLKLLQKHAFIAGVPGSGKTNTMHHLASTLWRKHNIPFLALEPAKREYRALVKQKGMEDVYVFSPNADMSFPLHINPFEFPKGLILSEHIGNLKAVFEGSFPMDPPAPYILDSAIEAVYTKKGWSYDSVNDGKKEFPRMKELYEQFEEEMNKAGYVGDIRDNVRSVLQVRIGSLLRREMGNIFDVTESTIPPERWLEIPAIVELEALGKGPSNFMTLLLCTLVREALKVTPDYDKDHARHVIFIEEAHNLIGPDSEEATGTEADPKKTATAYIVKMLAEVRALKEGIIIADQLPTVMAPEVIKNTGLKIGLRITATDDRSLLGGTMAANSIQTEEMATFNIGRSLISYEGLQRPFTMQTHEWCGKWSTSKCGEEMDLSWCEKNCLHYINGDCIPDKSERKKTTNPPANNSELIDIIANRKVYREICDRSFIIEVTQFHYEHKEQEKQFNTLLYDIKRIKEMQAEIEKLETQYFKIAEQLEETLDEEEALELKNRFILIADTIQFKKNELETTYHSSQKINEAYDAIVRFVAYAESIQKRKKHWVSLGIKDFSRINTLISSGAKLNKIQTFVNCINTEQKRFILFAWALYEEANQFFSDATKISKKLEECNEIYKVKRKNK